MPWKPRVLDDEAAADGVPDEEAPLVLAALPVVVDDALPVPAPLLVLFWLFCFTVFVVFDAGVTWAAAVGAATCTYASTASAPGSGTMRTVAPVWGASITWPPPR